MSLVNPTDTITTGPFKSLSLFFPEVTLCVKISSLSVCLSLSVNVLFGIGYTLTLFTAYNS